MADNSTLFFIISSFALGVILILSRDKIPATLKRPLAILAIGFILFAFFLIVYSFFTAGM